MGVILYGSLFGRLASGIKSIQWLMLLIGGNLSSKYFTKISMNSSKIYWISMGILSPSSIVITSTSLGKKEKHTFSFLVSLLYCNDLCKLLYATCHGISNLLFFIPLTFWTVKLVLKTMGTFYLCWALQICSFWVYFVWWIGYLLRSFYVLDIL